MIHFLKNKAAANAGWLIFGNLFHKALAFLVGILTARYLGPGNYGLINYAAAYTTFFSSLCSLGINSVIIKDFADHPEEEGTAIGTSLILRAVSSLLSTVMIVGLVAILDHNEPLTITVVTLCSIGLIFQVFDTLNCWFQAKLQSKFSAIATLVSYTIVSAYRILLLILDKDVTWFALANTIDYIALACFLLWAYRKKNGPHFHFSKKKAKELLSASYSFILSGLMVSVYAATDKFMLKQMLDEASVGHYSLASSISVAWAFVLSSIIDSLVPGIIQAHKNDRLAYEQKNRLLYALVFYSCIVMSTLISVFANPIIRHLYGQEYLPAVTPLRIVVWYTAFSYLGVARNAWIVCENKQRYLKYLYVAAAAINVLLNLLLIPSMGASGAALASLITQISTTTVLPAMIPALRKNTSLMLEAITFWKTLPPHIQTNRE